MELFKQEDSMIKLKESRGQDLSVQLFDAMDDFISIVEELEEDESDFIEYQKTLSSSKRKDLVVYVNKFMPEMISSLKNIIKMV
jgi:hypothetical protein